MMTPCREIAKILLSDAIETQSPWRRMEIRMHLSMCRFCGRFARQIYQIGEALRRTVGDDTALDGIESRLIDRLVRD